MKKIVTVILSVLFVFSLTGCVGTSSNASNSGYFSQDIKDYYASLGLEGTTVNVYNWGEYISDGSERSMDVVSEFEKLTGATVNYTNYESNENMYSKLSGGGVSYDVIIPSDYMIERLISENMLLELDYDNIPNFKYIADDAKNLYYDEGNQYTVPYNIGTTVLIYNTTLVEEKPTSWKILWDEKYKDNILLFNNSRDTFAIAQAVLGQDFNSTDENDWIAAAKLLQEQNRTMNPHYVMDEVFDLMESGEYALATYYAGDYELMVENNPDLAFCFPEEGVNQFYDAMCIPTSCQNKEGAEAFINFMQEPEVALANAEYICYASPNTEVVNNSEYSLADSKAVYPDEELTTQLFRNLPQDILELENELWVDVLQGTEIK